MYWPAVRVSGSPYSAGSGALPSREPQNRSGAAYLPTLILHIEMLSGVWMTAPPAAGGAHDRVATPHDVPKAAGPAVRADCPGREPPFPAVKRPTNPYERAIET